MDTFAGESSPRQDLFTEWRERDEGVDFVLVCSKPAMHDIHARYRCRPRQGRTETSMPQARPWKVADAFLAGLVLPKKQRIRARQPLVLQTLTNPPPPFHPPPKNTPPQH